MSIFVFLFWKIFEISSSMSLFVFVFISMFILIYMFVFKRLCLCICLHGRLSSVSIQQAISYVYVYVPSRPCRRSALHIFILKETLHRSSHVTTIDLQLADAVRCKVLLLSIFPFRKLLFYGRCGCQEAFSIFL